MPPSPDQRGARERPPGDTQGRILGIQGLRAIAVILVVAYHLGLPVGAGFVGVDVFFVISGFVITHMVLRRADGSQRIDLRAFWAGRVRRLLPALAAMVLMTTVLAVAFASPVGMQTQTGVTGIAASAWFSNGVLALLGSGYFATDATLNPLLHTWSLAVEEQFYVFFPLLVAVALWWTRRRGGSAPARVGRWLVVVGVLSFAVCLVLTFVRLSLPVGQLIAFYAPFTRAWEFVAGAVVAVAFLRGWRPGSWVRASLPVGAVLLVVGLVLIKEGAEFPGWVAAVPVGATVLLLIGAVHGAPGLAALRNAPMVRIGDLSYSWYLFHWPLIAYAETAYAGDAPLLVLLLVGVAGFGLAWLSHEYLEQPIRERRMLAGLRAPVLAAVVIVPTVVASIGLMAGAQRGWGDDDIRAMQTQLDHGQWEYQEVCQAPVQLDRRDPAPCRVEGDPAKRPLVLVGDSNAGVYAEMMVALGAELDRTVLIATVPSCALTDVELVDREGWSWLDCRAFYRSSMEWLAEQDPATVVIASGGGAVDSRDYALRPADGDLVTSRAEKQRVWQGSLERTYAALAAMGHDVVQVELVPHFDWSPARCSMAKMVSEGVPSCGTSLSRAEADDDQSRALAAERAAVSETDATLVPVRDLLCPQGRCRTNEGNQWRYEDGVHLSFATAMSLKPRFLEVLGR